MNPWLIAALVVIVILMCGAVNMALQGRLHARVCHHKFFNKSDSTCSHEVGTVCGYFVGPFMLIPTLVYMIGLAVGGMSDWHSWRMNQLRKKQERANAKLKLKETEARANGIELWPNMPVK